MRIKKIIIDAVEQWNSRLCDVVRKTDKKKDKSQSESADAVESEHSFLQSRESSGSPAITKKIKSLDQSDGKLVVLFTKTYGMSKFRRTTR